MRRRGKSVFVGAFCQSKTSESSREQLPLAQTSPLLLSTHSSGFQVFSSPSAVTSVTHTPVLKGFRKRRFAVFWFTQAGRSPANAAFQNAARRELSRQKAPPLPEVRVTFRLINLPVSPQKLPFHPTFEILHLPAGTFRSDARRKPTL